MRTGPELHYRGERAGYEREGDQVRDFKVSISSLTEKEQCSLYIFLNCRWGSVPPPFVLKLLQDQTDFSLSSRKYINLLYSKDLKLNS